MVVLCQQGQVVVELVALVGVAAGVVQPAPAQRAFQAALARHVGLDADDGLDPGLVGRLVEVEDAVHVAVVGDGDGRLAVFGRPFDHLVHPGRPVQHGELGVEVQVGKRLLTCVATSSSASQL